MRHTTASSLLLSILAHTQIVLGRDDETEISVSRRMTGDDPSHAAGLPPWSRHRTNDISLLPAQVCGIVGAYFCTVTIIGICLLTFGRRLRREAQLACAPSLEFEMIKSPGQLHDPQPTSPASTTRSFRKFFAKRSSTPDIQPASPHSSVRLEPNHPSIDARVVEDDKQRAQNDLAMLYGAVMEQEAASKNGVFPSKEQAIIVAHQEVSQDSTSPRSQHGSTGAVSPRSPVSANYSLSARQTAGSIDSLADRLAPRSPNSGLPASPRSARNTMMSIESTTSKKRAGRWNKTLRIAAVSSRDYRNDEERTPLSATFGPSEGPHSSTPYTAKSHESHASDYTDAGYENLDRPQPLPSANPQRITGHAETMRTTVTAASSTSTLPLRNLNTSGNADIPPTPVKTTYLDIYNRMNSKGPRTAGLTPKTGGPMTPYSPYMPHTPVTPVTPHLVTKKERKLRAKESRLQQLANDDGGLVSSTAETFGSAY